MLIDGDTAQQVRTIIDWSDFYLPREREIARAIFALAECGATITFVPVAEQLARFGKVKEAGGPDYLHELAGLVPHSGHVLYYAKTIAEKSRRRRLAHKAHDLLRMLSDPTTETDDACAFADGLTAHLDRSRAAILGELQTNGTMIAEAKPPTFRVRNFLTAGTLAVWSAPEKAWKTTLGHHAALVVAGHGKFLGLYDAVSTGPVIYFSGESGSWPLKSMQDRILEWTYPADIAAWDGAAVALRPDPASIPITWGGDPPDLGNPETIPALAELIRKTGGVLMILDPSQAMFGSISEDVKNDPAMRQYLKKLQGLARETGCCIVVLHHFRQHVAPGFPKRSDSSYGAFMKFCDTWILMNTREEPAGNEDPGSGKLWITWGSRDGFGASHAIDIAEGTHETGRFFDLQVIDVDHARDQIAERQAERKGQARKAASKANSDERKAEIRESLVGRVAGVSRESLAAAMFTTRQSIGPAVNAMLESGELVEVPVEYRNHGKVCWTTGLALRATAPKIVEAATSMGWKPSQAGTGVTPVTGANPAQLTPVDAEGDAPPCATP